MAKDSGKKVAKAARLGGKGRTRRSGEQALGFPLAVAAVLVLGVVLVIYARGQHESIAGEEPRIGADHWHAAYGVYQCDTFLPDPVDVGADVLGIHTHNDGLLHIHPFATSAAGPNARFGVFADQIDLDISDDELQFSDGSTFGPDSTCGDEPAEIRAVAWDQVRDDLGREPSEPREVDLADLEDLPLKQDQGIVIALVPVGTDLADIPPPPSRANIANVTDVQGGTPEGSEVTTTTTADQDGSTTDTEDDGSEPEPETTSSTTGS